MARSEESRRQEQTRAEQELADTKDKLQGEVTSLQEKITQLVRRWNAEHCLVEMKN